MDGWAWAYLWTYVVLHSVETGLDPGWNQQILPSSDLEKVEETQGGVQKEDENPKVFLRLETPMLIPFGATAVAKRKTWENRSQPWKWLFQKVRSWGPASDMSITSRGHFLQTEDGNFIRSKRLYFLDSSHFLATTGWSWAEWNQTSAVNKALCCNDGPWSKLLSNKVADLSPIHFYTFWETKPQILGNKVRVWLWSTAKSTTLFKTRRRFKRLLKMWWLCVYH